MEELYNVVCYIVWMLVENKGEDMQNGKFVIFYRFVKVFNFNFYIEVYILSFLQYFVILIFKFLI